MAILDEVEIIKPEFPGQQPETPGGPKLPYDFLASIGLTENVLKNSCVKKVEIVGIDTTETVTVDLDGTEYPDVPVWVHTDVGTRLQMVKDEPLEDPSLYFKNAALMFPTVECEALALVYTNPETLAKEVVCIFHVIKGPKGEFITDTNDAYPTYRMYARFALFSDVLVDARYYLYDMLNDSVATIPTIPIGGGPPELPFFAADGITEANVHLIENFCSQGISIEANTMGVATTFGDPVMSLASPEGDATCYPEVGTPQTPAWVQVQGPIPSMSSMTLDVEYFEEYDAACCGGNILISATNHSSGSTEGDLQYEKSSIVDMPIVYQTGNSYYTAGAISFPSTQEQMSSLWTLPDSLGTVSQMIQMNGTSKQEYRYTHVNGSDGQSYLYEATGETVIDCVVNFTGQDPMTLSWTVTGTSYNFVNDLWYTTNQDTISEGREAVRLGKMFRVGNNLFCNFISASLFCFVDHITYTYEVRMVDGYVTVVTDETVSVKECLGPSKDFVYGKSFVNDLNMTTYAYGELETYILAGSYEINDFVLPDDQPCGIVFSGFYFVPYDIREDLLEEEEI